MIRTLGTGVSPYNGLASVSIFAVCNHIKRLQSDEGLETGQNRSHSAIFVLHFVLQFRGDLRRRETVWRSVFAIQMSSFKNLSIR